MELSVAGLIGVKEFYTTYNHKLKKFVYADEATNLWLENNPDLEVIDVKYNGKNILVVYNKNS